ncbi:MAG TPA: VOC family protein [Chryseosolibacter sp.]|nr:VOC family protein [Chryseosolibacter sp.]
MATMINPYLNFNGKTEEAFNFYKSVFGGEFAMLQRIKDTPGGDKVPAHEQNRVMHVALPIGKSTVLMASDIMESMGHTLSMGNNFSISVHTESEKEADKIFNGLVNGGKVNIPLEKQFWGSYYGMLTDKFGVQWMVSYDFGQPK